MAYSDQHPQEPEGTTPTPPPPTGAPQVPGPPSVPEPQGPGSLRSIQTLITVSIIAGPVSMIIGGVFLSLAAIVCAVVALVKARRVNVQDDANVMALQTIRRQAMVGIGIGVVAFGFNAVSLAMVLPALVDAMQSGDYSSVLDGSMSGSGTQGTEDPAGKSSVWG